MTGTPLENRITDLESILYFVLDRPAKIDSIDRAMSILALTQVRRRKRDVLPDLPPKIVTELPIDLSRQQRESYDLAEREGIVRLTERNEISIPHVLSLITRLKQICNFDPATGASAKLDDLVERLEEIAENGNKALVFTQFAGNDAGAERIAAGMAHLLPLVYTGRLDERERAAVLRRFDEDDTRPVLVLSLKAGGVGLNLQRASYVFHFDRWWNPAAEAQAEDRAHRIGQPGSVNVYRYVVKNSIEERIDRLIREKQELFQSVIDGAENSVLAHLTKADLVRLLAG
jgi:SNF2 family DNA or RNA helicase